MSKALLTLNAHRRSLNSMNGANSQPVASAKNETGDFDAFAEFCTARSARAALAN